MDKKEMKRYELLIASENWAHAGLRFSIELLGFYFGIELADNRHWNYETNTFDVTQ